MPYCKLLTSLVEWLAIKLDNESVSQIYKYWRLKCPIFWSEPQFHTGKLFIRLFSHTFQAIVPFRSAIATEGDTDSSSESDCNSLATHKNNDEKPIKGEMGI